MQLVIVALKPLSYQPFNPLSINKILPHCHKTNLTKAYLAYDLLTSAFKRHSTSQSRVEGQSSLPTKKVQNSKSLLHLKNFKIFY